MVATQLFDLARKPAVESVDDGTWRDLEFERLFSSVDFTLTALGSQCLYRKLRIYRDDPGVLEKDFAVYQVLKRDTALREQLQLSLWRLRSDSDALTCGSLFGELLADRRFKGLVLSMSGVSLLVFAAAILKLAPVWLMGAVILGNLFIRAFLRGSVHETFAATERLGRMLSVAARLARVDAAASISQPARLRGILKSAGDLGGSFRWFADRSNEFVASFYFWLDMIFLTDQVAAILVARHLRRHRDTLAQVFLQVGSLDADIAIASWLQRVPAYCPPVITDEKTVELTEGFHPLLTAPVPNSITLRGQSALVVGTNMAGKTTFIKMVGTNIILGRTLSVCFASAAILPRSNVMASIRA